MTNVIKTLMMAIAVFAFSSTANAWEELEPNLNLSDRLIFSDHDGTTSADYVMSQVRQDPMKYAKQHAIQFAKKLIPDKEVRDAVYGVAATGYRIYDFANGGELKASKRFGRDREFKLSAGVTYEGEGSLQLRYQPDDWVNNNAEWRMGLTNYDDEQVATFKFSMQF